MARYWVNLWTEIPRPSKKELPLQKELEKLSTDIRGEDVVTYVFITSNYEEAVNILKQVKDLYRKHGFKDDLNIVRQPECPKCGYLGRFNDTFCPKCGTKLEVE